MNKTETDFQHLWIRNYNRNSLAEHHGVQFANLFFVQKDWVFSMQTLCSCQSCKKWRSITSKAPTAKPCLKINYFRTKVLFHTSLSIIFATRLYLRKETYISNNLHALYHHQADFLEGTFCLCVENVMSVLVQYTTMGVGRGRRVPWPLPAVEILHFPIIFLASCLLSYE